MTESVHQFSVQIAKYAFWSATQGEAVSAMPISAIYARRLGYEPYMLFGVSVEGLPIRRVHFTRPGALHNPAEFLLSVWQRMQALRGLPDRLKVHSLVDEAWPPLRAFVRDLGIEYEVADGRDKSFNVGLRYQQEEAWSLGHRLGWGFVSTRASLNDVAEADDSLGLDDLSHRGDRPQVREAFTRAKERAAKPVPDMAVAPAMDVPSSAAFDVGQGKIAPVLAVCVQTGSNVNWLLDRGRADEGFPLLVADADVLRRGASQAEVFELRDCVKPLIDCWPGSTTAAARAVKMPKPRLEAFLSGNGEVDRDEMKRIRRFFKVELDWSGYLQAAGAYLLQARKAVSIKAAYEALSHGGDLQLSAEILPAQAAADPSWRYLLFWPHSGQASIFMFPRGDKVAALLEPEAQRLINLGKPVTVDDAFYQFVVRTAARVAATPATYENVMAALTERIDRAVRKRSR